MQTKETKLINGTLLARARRRAYLAFTLVELLVVIALSALILALLLVPLIQGFRFTNRAKALVEAQDSTRFSIETIKREIATASYVYDNSQTPIVLPLGPVNGNDNRPNIYGEMYPVAQNGQPNKRPVILYGLIDLLPPVERGQRSTDPIDPTTGRPIGGTPVILPGSASATRMVRYFVGLRNNTPTGNQTEAFYQNVYEFPRTDTSMNTFILYRAEFNPQDPNLVNPAAAATPYALGQAGLHDPNFFYNTGTAQNGRTYAQNWRAIASPIMSSTNLDLIAWRRQNGQNNSPILRGSPFQLNVGFTPSAVVGDTATPGFLSNTAAETPGAVPSLYASKFGQWTLPYSVTFYRSPSRGDDNAQFGSVRFTVSLESNGNGLEQFLRIRRHEPRGIFTEDQPYYWLRDELTGKLIVHMANLTFQIDPARGRIETAFPPLATQNGVPLYRSGNGQAQPLAPFENGNSGTLVATLYRKPTFEAGRAGNVYQGKTIPANQGILVARLDDARYFDVTGATNTPYPSLFTTFGNNGALNPFGGVMIVPGSERVTGPDNEAIRVPGTNTRYFPLVSYFRVPALTGSIRKTASIYTDATEGRLYQRNGLLNYRLEADLDAYNTPFLQFDEAAGLDALDPNTYAVANAVVGDTAAGLPAGPGGRIPFQNGAEATVDVSYLWQNNYSRAANGQPLNAAGQSIVILADDPDVRFARNNTPRAEADVVKVDYSTRSQINVILGARVYDTSSGTPQAAQVTDKVVVTNANR